MAKMDQLITKDELIGKVADTSNETKASANACIEALPKVVIGTLLEHLPKKADEWSGAVPLPGLGAFNVKRVPAKTRKDNLRGGGEYVVPEHNMPSFKISKAVKTAVNADVLAEMKKTRAAKPKTEEPAAKSDKKDNSTSKTTKTKSTKDAKSA